MLSQFMDAKRQREKVQERLENALFALSRFKNIDVVERKISECWDMMEEYNRLTITMQECADTLNPLRSKNGLRPLLFTATTYEIER